MGRIGQRHGHLDVFLLAGRGHPALFDRAYRRREFFSGHGLVWLEVAVGVKRLVSGIAIGNESAAATPFRLETESGEQVVVAEGFDVSEGPMLVGNVVEVGVSNARPPESAAPPPSAVRDSCTA